MLYKSTQFWFYLPGVRVETYRLNSQSYEIAPLLNFGYQSQVQVVTWTTDQLAINQRFLWPCSLGSINLLELLTEFTVTLCLPAKLLQSCPTLQIYGLWPTRLLCPRDSPVKNTGVWVAMPTLSNTLLTKFCCSVTMSCSTLSPPHGL